MAAMLLDNAFCPVCRAYDMVLTHKRTLDRAITANDTRTAGFVGEMLNQVDEWIQEMVEYLQECGGAPESLDHIAWSHPEWMGFSA